MDEGAPEAANDDASQGAPLQQPDPSRAAWAKFDAVWYLRTYPQVRGGLFDLAESSVLAYYREHGQKRGHSPNPFFDEQVFLRADKTAADAVHDGAAASGFELYCRHLGRHRKPHWLFDEAYYRRLYPDLTDARLAGSGLVNGYDHFLRHGAGERRFGSPFFDPAVYLANLEPADAARAETEGCFIAYITTLHAGSARERTTSHYFDPTWYLAQYPLVAELITKRRALSALHHYLTNDAATDFDPIPQFSEQFYLKLYPDVAAAVRKGTFRNGFEHFVYHGMFERRQPSETIDLKYYVDRHHSVRDDLRRGIARDAFTHYLRVGRTQGLHAWPLTDETVTEGQATTLFGIRAQVLPPLLGRRPLDFAHDGQPVLSVIMTLRNGLTLTLQALASLRSNFAGAIELILVDLGSADETMQIERCVRGATMLRFGADIGVLRGRNAGIQGALADVLLLLDNDVELAPAAVSAGLDRLAADAKIGAVGGKVVGANGHLQEAGCIVWRDGAIQAYQRGALPSAPEAHFLRDVDFCSGGFLMARTDLLRLLGGFAADYPPGTCEDADLGLRIAASGHRTVYDPHIVVHRLTRVAPVSSADMMQARTILLRLFADDLGGHPIASPAAELMARTAAAATAHRPRRRILFIGETIPLRMLGGGAVRSNDMIAAMASIGADVTVFPILPHGLDHAAVYADIPDSVEVMHDRTIDDLADFLNRRRGYYDIVWIAEVAALDLARPILAAAVADLGRPLRVILDVAALQAVGSAALSGEAASGAVDVDGAVKAEFANAAFCHQVVAVNHQEAGWLRDIGLDVVSIIGPVQLPAPTPRRFEDRSGLLFVGAIHAAGTPNHDSLCWFVDAVLPLVEETLGWETRLTIAGISDDAAALDRFRGHPRVTLRGALVDMTNHYDAHRIFVAPTRFGAGLPYKVYEAASRGLPIVASDVVSRQMEWVDGQELLSASVTDPARYAERIVELYRDEALWQRLHDAALARLAADNSPERAAAALRTLLR